MKVQIRFPLVQ